MSLIPVSRKQSALARYWQRTPSESGSNSLVDLGASLGEAVVAPAVRKALVDPATQDLAAVQVAGILQSETVQNAIRPMIRKAAIYGFLGVIGGAIVANIITKRLL